MKLYRLANFLSRNNIPVLPKLIYYFNRVVFSVVLPASTQIGKNVILGYQGLGIVIHPRVIIGDGVVIGTNVTIGGRSKIYAVPIIGNDTVIGSGAKILGPIKVGHHVDIGANAVVINDVPDYAVVVGVPAKVIRIKNKL
ncbi:serine acetyltransferase [Deefgea piscis]|uniref:Serine acetyltransferase n=1 Tax=Deefgea piscis TaxID=2739061 RepID=A0A6M8STZ6_9NEIS|nr:serine acetyltransferase [Deefgea piscis]